MKKRLFAVLILLMVSLTACGSSNVGGYSNSYSDGFTMNESASSWSGTTYVTGDNVDYNYVFYAQGLTDHDKDYMLDHFEQIQTFVISYGGFISTVNNSYTAYEISADATYISSREINYEASGVLNFTVEVPNEHIVDVIEYIEDFCDTVNFDVTRFNQNIINYDGHKVVDQYSDNYWDRQDEITKDDLEYRTAYAELYVNISYYIPRGFFAKTGYTLRGIWREFWDGLGDIIIGFVSIAVGFNVLFIFGILMFKMWKRIIYNDKKKHPKYYDNTKTIVVTDKKDS